MVIRSTEDWDPEERKVLMDYDRLCALCASPTDATLARAVCPNCAPHWTPSIGVILRAEESGGEEIAAVLRANGLNARSLPYAYLTQIDTVLFCVYVPDEESFAAQEIVLNQNIPMDWRAA